VEKGSLDYSNVLFKFLKGTQNGFLCGIVVKIRKLYFFKSGQSKFGENLTTGRFPSETAVHRLVKDYVLYTVDLNDPECLVIQSWERVSRAEITQESGLQEEESPVVQIRIETLSGCSLPAFVLTEGFPPPL